MADDDDGDELALGAIPGAAPVYSLDALFRALAETGISAFVIWLILGHIHPEGGEYTPTMIALAALPVLLWLLYSGRISGFKAFGVELKGAIEKATSARVDVLTDDSMPVEYVPSNPREKGPIPEIDAYISSGVETLYFELGKKRYYTANAIGEYLGAMTQRGNLKWVIFQDKLGRLQGFTSASSLKNYAYRKTSYENYEELKNDIEGQKLPDIPGLVQAKDALKETDTKAKAIARFARIEAEYLPIVDGSGKFKGVVDRGKLVTSVLNSIIQASRR